MKKNSITVFVLFSLFNYSHAQYFQSKNYPKNFFQSPVEIPLQLSANFGEVRPNHFHMGLDIRTNQKENYRVLASAEGYVSRIKIETYGYGRAIYITHPNGYTTVYAHLNEFYNELEKEVLAKQYEGMQWEQDIEFPINKYRVSKGQFIAFSGNTGSSQGPHLHFEIRDNKTGNTLNPLLFGLKVLDNIPPKLYNFFYYNRNFSTYEKGPEKIKIKSSKNEYITEDTILKIETNKISFGIQAEDRTNNSSFYFGIYQAEIWIDDTLKSAFQLDDISYNSSRFVNGCFDYKTKAENGPIIQHLSQLPGNYSAIFSEKTSDGIIELSDTLVHSIEINIHDASGNISTLKTKIQFQPNNNSSFSNFDSYLFPNSKNYITTSECIIEFENSSFYDKVPYNYKSLNPTEEFVVSNEHEPLSNNIPVNESFKIRIKANKPISKDWKDKVVMQAVNNKKVHSSKGKWIGDWYEAKFINLEKFRLIVDSFPPNINPIGWNDSSNIDSKQLVLKVSDNEGSIHHFVAELDGNWIMFKRKGDNFIHDFNENISLGWHLLKVSVLDIAGNQTIKYFSFNKLETPVVKPKAKKKPTSKRKKMFHLKEKDKAPVFKSINQNGNKIQLKDFKGKKLVLYFYPKDNTESCTNQACNIRDNYKELQKKGIEIVGVSPDDEISHKKFETKFKLPFTLLVDDDTKIAENYGVWGPKKFMGREYIGLHRTTFLINEKGIIEKIITRPLTKKHTQQILEAWGL